ncbi:hypothetical protein OF83DRAFT_1056957 [Amylostereum chailletii]|nr:hypothetical protein OF83DRAFT_1056957 [Amylostereum chailletii]
MLKTRQRTRRLTDPRKYPSRPRTSPLSSPTRVASKPSPKTPPIIPPAPSSLSEVEQTSEMSSDDSDEHPQGTPSAPPSRREPAPEPPPATSSWTDLDLSIVIALAAPIGSWLTGGDHLKNAILILLLIIYLHQLITIPWELYRSARPRRPHPHFASAHPDNTETARLQRLATTELHRHEFFYLLLAIITPFLGAKLLRVVLASINGSHKLSWFSTTLFILATGIRPWSHAIARLRERTASLHDAVHYPSSEHQRVSEAKLQSVLDRVEVLEKELALVKEVMATEAYVDEGLRDLDEGLEAVERMVEKSERKTETTRVAHENRLFIVEKGVSRVAERRHDLSLRSSATIATQTKSLGTEPAFPAMIHALSFLWMIITLGFLRQSTHTRPSPRRPVRQKGVPSAHSVSSPRRLETIPEDIPMVVTGIVASPDSDPDSDLADNEEYGKARSPVDQSPETPPSLKQSMVQTTSNVVSLPYRTSVGILTTAASQVQRLWR